MGSFEKNSREAVSFIMIRVWLLLGLCAVLASGRHYHVQYVPLPHQYYPQQQQYYLQPQQYYPQQQQYYLQPQQYYQQPQQYYIQPQQYYPQPKQYYLQLQQLCQQQQVVSDSEPQSSSPSRESRFFFPLYQMMSLPPFRDNEVINTVEAFMGIPPPGASEDEDHGDEVDHDEDPDLAQDPAAIGMDGDGMQVA